jgi:hypothetical protein
MRNSNARQEQAEALLMLPPAAQPLVASSYSSQAPAAAVDVNDLIEQYVSWLFSLPLSSATLFSYYLLQLTQGVLLPPQPSPPLLDSIAAPDAELLPPHLVSSPSALSLPPNSTLSLSCLRVLGSDEKHEVLVQLISSRVYMQRCMEMMTHGPLLAASRIAVALLSLLSLPAPLSSSPTASPQQHSPLLLLRSYHLSASLPLLISRTAWALSPAAVVSPPLSAPPEGSNDPSNAEHLRYYSAYYLHEVSVSTLRSLHVQLLQLQSALREEEGWVRAQKRALLLAALRAGRAAGAGGAGIGLSTLLSDSLYDRHLLSELFAYIWL